MIVPEHLHDDYYYLKGFRDCFFLIKKIESKDVSTINNAGAIYLKKHNELKLKLLEYHSSKTVDHPVHYGGEDNIYEAIKVIEAWNLDFCLGNSLKYISRAGKKDESKTLEDLEKAKWYLERAISKIKQND